MWITARILHLHAEVNNLRTVARIPIANKYQFKRPIAKLCPLPIPDNEDNNLKTTLQAARNDNTIMESPNAR